MQTDSQFSKMRYEGGAGGGSPSRGKPEGVRACELWVKVGAPAPAQDADWIFQQAAQRSPAQMSMAQGVPGTPHLSLE